MVKMLFELDEKKVEKCGEYTVEQIYDYIDEIFALTKITKIERFEHGRMYYGNGNNQDLVNLFMPIFHMEKEEWLLKYSEKIWFLDNFMCANKEDFDYEDVLESIREKYSKGNAD
ncbi:MAG TPA: hypothetical protein DCG28_04910 [Lachnospiraceae bacterium]|nr:hypothetical protein [Lachnospiraceae bacterium]